MSELARDGEQQRRVEEIRARLERGCQGHDVDPTWTMPASTVCECFEDDAEWLLDRLQAAEERAAAAEQAMRAVLDELMPALCDDPVDRSRVMHAEFVVVKALGLLYEPQPATGDVEGVGDAG